MNISTMQYIDRKQDLAQLINPQDTLKVANFVQGAIFNSGVYSFNIAEESFEIAHAGDLNFFIDSEYGVTFTWQELELYILGLLAEDCGAISDAWSAISEGGIH